MLREYKVQLSESPKILKSTKT